MQLIYNNLFNALWLSWGIYWMVAAANVKETTRVEPVWSRVAHIIPLAAAALLLAWPLPGHGFLFDTLLPPGLWMFWVGVAMTAAGLLFTVWARVYLGRNWSGLVTLKQDHELIIAGPYRLVRHPVYTGLLFAFLGSGLARDDWRAVFAIALAVAALWRKLRLEESWLMEQFGDRYVEYRQRVAALIPGII